MTAPNSCGVALPGHGMTKSLRTNCPDSCVMNVRTSTSPRDGTGNGNCMTASPFSASASRTAASTSSSGA
jgi:hypothetical protein